MGTKESTGADNARLHVEVPLDEPIKRGEQVIASVTVRKPSSGELRGVSLVDLANVNVVALQQVLPRITNPTLTTHDVAQLDPADLMSLGVEVASFLVRKEMRLSASPSE